MCFRNSFLAAMLDRIAARPRLAKTALAAALGLGSVASLACIVDPGLLLGPGNSVSDWVQNAVSGSGVEQALFRLMTVPGGEILFRRSPRESRPELSNLLQANPGKAALYSLRAMEDERALDFNAAEQDWKIWAQKADDRAGASLDLADFYERRLKPQEELVALAVVGASATPQAERLKGPAEQRPWKAWEQSLAVVDRFALPRAAAGEIYNRWERRYPQEREVYQKELDFALSGKDFPAAAAVIDRYRKALPSEREFPVTAEATLESARGGEAAGAAVYERAFEPLWPTTLVESYMNLLTANHGARRAIDNLHSQLAAHPEGGSDALKDVARLYYLNQKLGQLDTAKLELSNYRKRKEARGANWSPEELSTLGQLYEQAQDFPEAAHYYYALAAQKATGNDEEQGLAGLARILLTAPEQPLRIGAGNLALYKNIATIDRGPGYWNGILSLWMNSQDPSGEFASQDELATPYFHRAKAAQIIAEIDKRFAQAADRPDLHQRLMTAYAAYGEDAAVIREGTAFLAQFPGNQRRVEVALTVADIYSRTGQTDKEIALYREQLKELAARSEGLPLNSADYQRVLDRALARLVQLNRLPEALALLRGELDHNPNDPGLYDRLAQFLEQNRMNEQQEDVYQKAIAQFQQSGLVDGWYGKLARFYLRQRRREDYRSLTRKVTGIFSGTELERYLQEAPAPDSSFAYEVNRYAHERFPHDLTFVHALINYQRAHRQEDEMEKLLWEHWSEDPGLRDELFARLSANGRLDAQLEVLKKQTPEIDRADWNGLARSNPAAELFWVDSCLWRSHFEDGVAAAEALSAEYPANARIGETASSLERSLAYFQPAATDKAVAIEVRLLQSDPGNLDRMARIGDIYADRGRMSEAAPYWLRMAEVHPGDNQGYLQSATVFWDYFDFGAAMAQLQKGREKLAQPALFSYETGAIKESQGDLSGAIRDYAAGALAGTPSTESRSRFLALARRPEMQSLVEAQTEGLLRASAPTQSAIDLRVAVLDASHRGDQVARELREAIAHADSFATLEALASAARGHGLREVEEAALNRQVSLTEDPVHKLELRYQLVDLIARRDVSAAAAEIDAIYRENPKILGVVRSTVDYDWNHERRAQAVTVLLDAAQSAYPDLRDKLQLEAGRKLTEEADYSRARKLLEDLLSRTPLDASVETALAANYARSGDNAGLTAFYRTRLETVKSANMDHDEKVNRLAQLRRGMIPAAMQLGQWDVATDQYIELINSYPGDAVLVQEAAQAAGDHGQSERLTGFYRQTIEHSPRDARWSIVLGEIETALEDFPAAIDAYSKAIRVRPEQKDLYIARAGLCERLHRLDDAVADYDKLYSLSYHDPAWKLKIAEARARQGRNTDAVKALEEAWILGHPASASDQFRVAAQLEQWNLLQEARTYAEHGADLSGPSWLIDPGVNNGVTTYARIMARLRLNDEAFNRLAAARMKAEQLLVDTSFNNAPFDPNAGISLDEWRNHLHNDYGVRARQGFAQGLQAMGNVVALYATPEEKTQFANWLQSKSSTASDGAELRIVYLPTVQAAGLKMMEADLLWQFVNKSNDPTKGELSTWLQLQRSRVQLDDAGKRLEDLSTQVSYKQRAVVLSDAVEVYRTLNDSDAELRVHSALDHMPGAGNAISDRYFDLLLAARPNELVARSSKDGVAQRMLEKAKPELALDAINVRANNLPPVWKSAYTGLAGLYLRVHQPVIRQGFEDALAPDRTIGERLEQPAEGATDRNRQLAGAIWFYYGSRYGEYLDEEKDQRAEGLLEAELEHTPARASAYSDLASYLESAGRPEAALADYQHSLALLRDQPTVLNDIAVLESNSGHRSEAVIAWKQAVHLLAEEMDARKVPETFWDSYCAVLEGASKHNAYGEVSADVDNMLRIYLRRNGPYRAEPLLQSGYEANNKSLSWLINMVSQVHSEDDNGFLLRQLAQNSWVAAEQRIELQSRVIDQLRAHQKPGERDYDLEYMERNLVQALLDEHQYARARSELEHFTATDHKVLDTTGYDQSWIDIQLQLADVEKSLPELLARWKKNPTGVPANDILQTAALKLSEPGRRTLLRFVYENALENRQLTAANFLGLAGVDLDENKKDAALELLKRLTLAGSDMFADTDAAASLLEKRKLYSEALPFLRTLADAFPWKADYRVRLAAADLAANPQNNASVATLTAVAADPKAFYADRLAAAQALRGHAKGGTGSIELDLVTHTGCIGADEASRPYFVAARLAAATCVQNPTRREALLRGTLADAPDNSLVRLRYVQAAFAASDPHLALLAFESLNTSGLFGITPSYPQYDESGQPIPAQPALDSALLNPEERSKLFWLIVRAHEKRGEDDQALGMLTSFIPAEKDAPRKTALEKERNRLQLEVARQTENQARAPIIHRQLEQDRVVRPRLQEGAAFVPNKPALFEEAPE